MRPLKRPFSAEGGIAPGVLRRGRGGPSHVLIPARFNGLTRRVEMRKPVETGCYREQECEPQALACADPRELKLAARLCAAVPREAL